MTKVLNALGEKGKIIQEYLDIRIKEGKYNPEDWLETPRGTMHFENLQFVLDTFHVFKEVEGQIVSAPMDKYQKSEYNSTMKEARDYIASRYFNKYPSFDQVIHFIRTGEYKAQDLKSFHEIKDYIQNYKQNNK